MLKELVKESISKPTQHKHPVEKKSGLQRNYQLTS